MAVLDLLLVSVELLGQLTVAYKQFEESLKINTSLW